MHIKEDLSLLATIVIIITVAASISWALLYYTVTINNSGHILVVGCKVTDENGNLITLIDWRILNPGSSATRLILIENNGTTPITMNLTTQNWNPPEASQHIGLSWNYTNQLINPTEKIPIQLIVSISTTIIGTGITDFALDIVVTATQEA